MKRVNTEQERLNNPVNPLIGGIGVQTIFTAILAVAITFTLSCSGSDDPDNGGDGSGVNVPLNGGVVSMSNTQIYNEDGSKYTGSGIVKWSFSDSDDNDTTINIISVTNGIVKLELPTFPEKYPYGDGWINRLEISPKGTIIYAEDDFWFLNNDGSEGKLSLGYSDRDYLYYVFFIYSPKDAKIAGMDVKKGWHTIYARTGSANCDGYEGDEEMEACYRDKESKNLLNTDNFFTQEPKWTFQSND
jgi:hypothetical protein